MERLPFGPGVQCASMGLSQGVVRLWMENGRGRSAGLCLLGRSCGRVGWAGGLVQGAATSAHAGGGKADQIFVATGEPEMKPVVTNDAEKLAAVAASPLLLVDSRVSTWQCGRIGTFLDGLDRH